MTEITPAATTVDIVPAEPAVVTAVRQTLGTRRPLGAAPGRRRTGMPDTRVDRLDLLGELLAPETATLAVLWLASTRRASVATRRGYADDLLAWAGWWAGTRGGRLDLAAITRPDVTRWLAEQQATGARPATITRRLSALSSLYRYAASHGLPLVCPITEDHRPQVQRGRHDRSARVLTGDQVSALARACADVRDALVVAILTTDGLRVAELCAADDPDVTSEGHRVWLWVTRKGGRRVRVALDPVVAELLDAYRAERPAAPAGEPLIRDSDGQRIDRHDVARLLRRVARAAGIPDPARVTPHALRASAITHLIRARRPVTEVQQWAGHADISTTMVYLGEVDRDERAAAMTAELAGLVTLPAWLRRPSMRGE